MNECCGDGNFCDFPWCDCIGNADFRRLHKLVKPDDPWQDCGRPWCNTCRHRRPVVAHGVNPSALVQMPDKARAGIEALHCAIESLLTTGRFVDEEGEATHALEDLLDRITDGVHDATTAEALRCLRNVKVLLGTDSPEVRGWAPAVQQATQKSINTAIQALARGVPDPSGGKNND